jgi:hypothetical protein
MANYTIIGGDNKEYGPVTGEEIRQWVVEGRLDGNSRARGENDTEWRSLSAFPEFATLFQSRAQTQTPPPLGLRPDTGRENAAEAVKNPALCLIFSALLNLVMALWGLVQALFFPVNINQEMAAFPQFNDPQFQKMLNDPEVQKIMHLMYNPGVLLANSVFALVMSLLVLLGALRMKALRSYEFAFVAAILAMVPCLTPCCLVGLPFGIWALMVLARPGIKGQFH